MPEAFLTRSKLVRFAETIDAVPSTRETGASKSLNISERLALTALQMSLKWLAVTYPDRRSQPDQIQWRLNRLASGDRNQAEIIVSMLERNFPDSPSIQGLRAKTRGFIEALKSPS